MAVTMTTRFGHETWSGAKCGHCGYTETEPDGGFYDDIYLYALKCSICGRTGCEKCIRNYPRRGNSVSLDDQGKVTLSMMRCAECQQKREEG